jgi:intracellular sulfur oxidation DsrE/DsrF family protein
MARRVVSLVRRPPAALRGADPVLEANAYAVAEAVDLTVVLTGSAVELALAGGEVPPRSVGGVPLPPAAADQDLRGLLESGVDVYVAAEDLERMGIDAQQLVEGVRVTDAAAIARALRDAEAVLAW